MSERYSGPIKQDDYLEGFYFVTVSGAVYQACSCKKEDGTSSHAYVNKIAHKGGASSKIQVGTGLPSGTYLAITAREGVFFYDEDHPREGARLRPEGTNYAFWKGGTSKIVALFHDSLRAKDCADESGNSGTAFDPRWADETENILNEIGDDHPRFVPSRSRDLDPWTALEAAKKKA